MDFKFWIYCLEVTVTISFKFRIWKKLTPFYKESNIPEIGY